MLTFHSPSMGEAFWSTQALDWTAEQTRLITHTQSLTVYLQQTQLPVRVQVLYSGTGTMTASEQAASQWPDKQPIFIREVVLRLNEMPVILARSICQLPHAHANHTDLNHFWLNLLNRGNHPLGLNLFHPEGQIQACTLHYAQFMPQFYAHAAQNFLTQSPLPARCRFFEHQTSHLLVTEFFLPELFPFFLNQPSDSA